jgi:hypothetical protein
MAREAVCDELYAERVLIGIHFKIHALKAFEALVRADEREEFQRWFVGVITQHEQLILAEREACAKVCENWTQTPETTGMELALCAAAIRARGNT